MEREGDGEVGVRGEREGDAIPDTRLHPFPLQDARKAMSVQVPQLPGTDVKFRILFVKVSIITP